MQPQVVLISTIHGPPSTLKIHHQPSRSTINLQDPPSTFKIHHQPSRFTINLQNPPFNLKGPLSTCKIQHQPSRSTFNCQDPPSTCKIHCQPLRSTHELSALSFQELTIINLQDLVVNDECFNIQPTRCTVFKVSRHPP